MRGTRIILGRTESSRGWRIGLFALMGVMAAAALVILLGGPSRTAHAAPARASSEPWLRLECTETLVEEGEHFRLVVRKKYDSNWPHEKMRVFWYTIAGTADETDYEYLYAVRQASNGSQSESGRMGRNFRTLEDRYSEVDETFVVIFNNSNDEGNEVDESERSCEITIADDDDVGIMSLEITSEPGDVTTESGDTVRAYGAGDVIEITARFNEAVTNVSRETGERADYPGIYIQVGEHRRIAELLRGAGTDKLVFGYTVQAEDEDADGISVEAGSKSAGFCFNNRTGDIGLWPASSSSNGMNRYYLGLDDDRDHKVVAVPEKEEDVDEKPTPPDATIKPPDPEPEPWVVRSQQIGTGLVFATSGELTEEDGGRDWFSFEAEGGESYIIELRNAMEFAVDPSAQHGIDMQYVDGDLVDPSILEVLNEDGEQVLGEHDRGGFMGFFARAFFTPDDDGTYYVAVGSGDQLPEGLGHYDFSVRLDDHADDLYTKSGFVLRPGKSVTARIDSDVSKNDPSLHFWHWIESTDGTALPMWGLESPDDRDVFPFEIDEAGTYELKVTDGPEDVGIWRTVDGRGNAYNIDRTTPVESLVDEYSPGTYYVDVGTPFDSSGNTGTYTLMLTRG